MYSYGASGGYHYVKSIFLEKYSFQIKGSTPYNRLLIFPPDTNMNLLAYRIHAQTMDFRYHCIHDRF